MIAKYIVHPVRYYNCVILVFDDENCPNIGGTVTILCKYMNGEEKNKELLFEHDIVS